MALGDMQAKAAVEPLIAIIQQSSDELLISRAAEALGKIGDKRALPALETLLNGMATDPRFAPFDVYQEQAKIGAGPIPSIKRAAERLRK